MDNLKNSKRKPLAKRETGVGARLREARELLRLSQAEFAGEVGISRQRLASYEELRAPLRFDLALKICRHFIFSEKWLATGEGDMRQCLDLNSRGQTYQVPIDTPFGQAYDLHLGTVYEKLRAANGDRVELALHDTSDYAFLGNYFTYLLGLWTKELPKTKAVPAGFEAELCSMLIGAGFAFVHFSVAHGRSPNAEELLSAWVKPAPQLPTGSGSAAPITKERLAKLEKDFAARLAKLGIQARVKVSVEGKAGK